MAGVTALLTVALILILATPIFAIKWMRSNMKRLIGGLAPSLAAPIPEWLSARTLLLEYRSVDIYTMRTFSCRNGFMPFTTKRQAIRLAADEKRRLESLRRSRSGAMREVLHAGILLDLAAGMSDGAAASSNGVNRHTVALCARKFLQFGLEAALGELPRAG
jgi:hypothetical protein